MPRQSSTKRATDITAQALSTFTKRQGVAPKGQNVTTAEDYNNIKQELAERRAKKEADTKAKEAADRPAEEAADRYAKAEAEAEAEADRQAKEVTDTKAKETAEKKAQEEAEVLRNQMISSNQRMHKRIATRIAEEEKADRVTIEEAYRKAKEDVKVVTIEPKENVKDFIREVLSPMSVLTQFDGHFSTINDVRLSLITI